jgi:hypothetical protein
MPDSFPGLRDRLTALGVLGRPRPAAVDRGGPTFEVRRSGRSLGEVFGRQGAPASERGVIYLDTETTGLSGGTGTIPFLIGLARVEDGEVCTEQFFLRRLSGEVDMLEAVGERLADAEAVVTFNGRRFDWPSLEARYIMCRMRLDPPQIHDDLMSAARRLWYRPLGTYRLSAIERALCIDRSDDIESWQIPGIYLDYLRTGDAAPLEAVFAHNRKDVACLLHLRRRVKRWIEAGEDPPAPVDWEGLGVLRLQAADGARAEDSFRKALTVEDDPAIRWRVATRLARLLRHASRWEDLLALWERDLGGRGVWRVRALIEVAKVYQRRFRLPARAVAALEDAVAVIEWLILRDDSAAPALDLEVSGRLSRLRAQLGRT